MERDITTIEYLISQVRQRRAAVRHFTTKEAEHRQRGENDLADDYRERLGYAKLFLQARRQELFDAIRNEKRRNSKNICNN